jgi:hypothetical protein
MLAQTAHCAFQFAQDYPQITSQWIRQSNYICILEVENEAVLSNLIEGAAEQDIRFSIFREPDIDNQITAVALMPGPQSKKLCRGLKLALYS